MNLEEKIDVSRKILRQGLAGTKNPVIAFSGGKDAIATALLAAEFGVRAAVCEESFYFTMQREDVRSLAKRLDLDCSFHDLLSLEWLAEHPQYLFSRNGAVRGRYFALRQQRTVAKFAARHGHDAVLFGRRNDTNAVRADYYTKDGRFQVFPIRYWHDEDVWQFLENNGIEKPRIYSTVYGANQFNGPWNIYNAHVDELSNWLDIYKVEPAIVHEASRFFPIARKALA